MCLYLKKDAKNMIAIDDIVVYKILAKNKKFIFTEYITPFMRFNVKFKKRYKCNDSNVLARKTDYTFHEYDYAIDIGFHSFPTLETAKNVYYDSFKSGNYVIVECIIPAASKYVSGMWDIHADIKSIVSDQIIYKKIVKI